MSAFKGTLTAERASRIIAEGLGHAGTPFEELAAGDGGRGTMAGLARACGGKIYRLKARNPLDEPIEVEVLQLPDRSIFLECASVCSLPAERRDVMRASTRGLGELLSRIRNCFSDEKLKVTVGIGDTSTSDGGSGMLQALGFRMPGTTGDGDSLLEIKSFERTEKDFLRGMELTVWCDVKNPLVGPHGSARIFAPQKGASPEQVKKLEAGMEHWSQLLGVGTEVHTGSGGGLGAAFLGALKVKLLPGAKSFLEAIDFSKRISFHSHVFTGEGKTDSQTLQGKVVGEIVSRLKDTPTKAVVFSGEIDEPGRQLLGQSGALGFSIGREPSAEVALHRMLKAYLDGPA